MRNLPTASPAATAFPLFRAPHPLAAKAIIAGALILLVCAGAPATNGWTDVLQTVPHPTGEALRHPDPVVHAYFQRSVELVHCAQRRPEEEIESSFESFQEVHHRLEQLHQRLTAVTAGDASGS